ncbi:MAG: 4-(cytidine 5'-diphospho)-2-C-methyl-D-erythritol kinase [Spirochaetaceae bacterium]|nr:4-(cytidine 5'-diphospho)-2-C-methyl-D-erythritol kinase [Spirochaetaceae bacterium]
MTYQLTPPAKINLHLEVLNKRSDGYHNLRSIFLKIALRDWLSITIHNRPTAKPTYQLISKTKFPLNNDLLYKAYRLYQNLSGLNFNLKVKLTKYIPMQAGLGGGSSDAASLLLCLNKHFNQVDDYTLLQQSAQLGADVPFFMQPANACLVEGLGEIVTPLNKPVEPLYVVIAKPALGMATGPSFGLLGRTQDYKAKMSKELLTEAWQNQNFSPLFNSFDILSNSYPYINNYKQIFNGYGSLYTALSGSGSSVLALFNKKEQAKAAHSVIRPLAHISYLGLCLN